MIAEYFNDLERADDFVKKLKGSFHKTAKGYNSYEIENAEANFIFKIAQVVKEKFHFTHANQVLGLEQMLMDFVKDGVTITIGWDIWSGCFIMAYDKAGDNYIQEIGIYLDALLNKL